MDAKAGEGSDREKLRNLERDVISILKGKDSKAIDRARARMEKEIIESIEGSE